MIRRELPEEEREVENLIREAFWNVYRPGCLEHFVMHCLRRDSAFIPELNLVMRVGERLIGQVAWRNGYYDYAHMSADFRKICGYAPMALLRISENDGDEVGWRI